MISIIVPIYNVEKYLSRCIDSILRQSYRDLELILVDDGSLDGCGVICDAYAKKDSRIIVIHQKNSGVSAARNAGLACAKGKFIGFIDPDDYIAPDMYQEMIEAMETTDAELVICGYNYVDEEGKIDERRRYPLAASESLTQEELMKRFSDMPPSIRLGVCNKLFKKNLLHDLKFMEGLHSSEDVLFLTEYACMINQASIVHKPLYFNTVRKGSATHGGLSINSLADSFAVHDKMYKTVVDKFPKLRDHSLAFLLDVCTLKYNEAKNKANQISGIEKTKVNIRLKLMRKYIKRMALRAIFDKEIYWKTRISYLILR